MGCSFIAGIQDAAGSVADMVAPVVAAIPGPWQIPAMAYIAVNTVEHGGSIGDVIKKVGMAYVAGELGGAVSGGVSSALAPVAEGAATAAEQSAINAALTGTAATPTLSSTLGNIAGSVAKSAVLGGNPLTAALSGGIGAGVTELTGQIPGFSELPAVAQKAAISAMTAELQGKDPTQALMNQALSAGVNATTGYSGPLPSVTGSASKSASSNPPSASPLSAPAAAVTALTASGALPDDVAYFNAAKPKSDTATVGQSGYDTKEPGLTQLYASLLGSPAGTPKGPASATNSSQIAQTLAQLQNNELVPTTGVYAKGGLVQHFAGGSEGIPVTDSATTTTTSPDYLAQGLKALSNADTAKMPKHDLRQIGSMGFAYSPKVLPQLAAVLRSRGMNLADGGRPDDHEHPNYDGTPVFRTGGLEGLGGKYVEGKGDGTSDDISAMLANGEYVFSADVVSALGNGSNKAGADKLGEMVEAIRARARSAPPDKLPPDAKSPLEYLKSSKGKKHG